MAGRGRSSKLKVESEKTGWKEAVRRIEEARAEGRENLDLGGLGLASLPAEIGNCTSLETLYLNNNQLTALPKEIGNCSSLQTLDLVNNQLTALPKEIENCSKLKVLSLDNNQLTALSKEIGNCTSLETLYFSNNQLTALPKEIGNCSSLQTLALGNNQLTALPKEIGNCTSLESLYLYNNELTALPEEIWNCSSLQTLDLDGNQLTVLPKEIGNCTSLQRLYFSNNQLTALPVELRELSSLTVLSLQGNPKLGIPEAVLGISIEQWNGNPDAEGFAKPAAILDYYFRTKSQRGKRRLCEGKLILVGRGEVGKTSLVKRLVRNEFLEKEETTHGIRIEKLTLTYPRKTDPEIVMNVWDFGGQEIMHATHQFFLTDRSLYLVVLDGRADQQEVEADYWLRLISGLAPESPVLVVLNKIRTNPFDLNRRAFQQKYPQVVGFYETDCWYPNKRKEVAKEGYGIKSLHQAILTEVNKNEHLKDIRMPFPEAWFEVKETLSPVAETLKTKAKKKLKNFLTLGDYAEVCEKHGVVEESEQKNLSVILHTLGIALNYSDDPRLKDRHVLNPHWLTTGIYKLMTSKRLEKQKGELEPEDLVRELNQREYPKEMHRFLIHLMEKFELCFGFPEKDEAANQGEKENGLCMRYLIPQLLDQQQPNVAGEFDEKSCLNFLYQYPVLPPGLLPRFIVRTYVLSNLDEQHRWRTGVILSFEGNRALVKGDPQTNAIRVLIDGPVKGRQKMLAVIRQDFDAIHRDLEKLKPRELVSFPKRPEVMVPYVELTSVLEQLGPQAVVTRSTEDGTLLSSSVKDLLDGVDFQLVGYESTKGKKLVGSKDEEPVRLFYSYSRFDMAMQLKLKKHLSPLERIGLVKGWWDQLIPPGEKWDEEIKMKLEESEIVLLLVSANFLDSEYCRNEMTWAWEMQKEILPVILRDVNGWKEQPLGDIKLGDLNARPISGNPITSFKRSDKGYADVSKGVEEMALGLRGKRGKTSRVNLRNSP
jgi:internalin A